MAIDRVSNVLLSAGCWQDTWNDQLFVRCDDAIFKRHGNLMANLTDLDEEYLSTVGNATFARVLGTFSNHTTPVVRIFPCTRTCSVAGSMCWLLSMSRLLFREYISEGTAKASHG